MKTSEKRKQHPREMQMKTCEKSGTMRGEGSEARRM